MTKQEIAQLKVGSKIQDTIGNELVIVKIDGLFYELKYTDNLNSRGSVFYVPSHFEYDTLVEI